MQTNYNLPPQCLEHEASVLSALLLFGQDNADTAADLLRPDDFYNTAHRYIFEACMTLVRKKEPIDLNTVAGELKRLDRLDAAGGGSFLSRVVDNPIPPKFSSYCDTIKKHSIYRQIIDKANRVVMAAFDAKEDARELLDRVQAEFVGIDCGGRDGQAVPIAELIQGAIDRYEDLYSRKCSVTGIPTGFVDFDARLCGFQASDLIIIAGRPGMGKSALAFNCAMNQNSMGFVPMIFSLEMSREQYINRTISMLSGIDNVKFRSGRFSQDEWARITDAAGQITEWRGLLDDSPGLTVGEIRRRIRRAKKRHGIQIVYVDYLKFVKVGSRRDRQRYLEVGEITEALKNVAKELSIPVVLVAQLNRECEKRGNKRPMLSDLRESGDIEQDADVVTFLYRDDYYDKSEHNPNRGIAELILAKHRNGPTGTIKLRWHDQCTKFNDLAYGEMT